MKYFLLSIALFPFAALAVEKCEVVDLSGYTQIIGKQGVSYKNSCVLRHKPSAWRKNHKVCYTDSSEVHADGRTEHIRTVSCN